MSNAKFVVSLLIWIKNYPVCRILYDFINYYRMIVLPDKKMPHLVLLLAGASLASFPAGDRNGNELPLMNSLVEKLDLYDYIPRKFENLTNDFEKLYSNICNDQTLSLVKNIIDKRVHEYFYYLEIPDKPTLYDYLILSLRKKDLIRSAVHFGF